MSLALSETMKTDFLAARPIEKGILSMVMLSICDTFFIVGNF